MAYKIAVGSSNGVNIDLKFGEVNEFLIYEADKGKYKLIETRKKDDEKTGDGRTDDDNRKCDDGKCAVTGCGGNKNGCNGESSVNHMVELISDCRCVVCAKIGFQAQKQFERKAISVFDVECSISEALDKITYYYEKADTHQSLKNK